MRTTIAHVVFATTAVVLGSAVATTTSIVMAAGEDAVAVNESSTISAFTHGTTALTAVSAKQPAHVRSSASISAITGAP
jgi:methylaspartate ammonia-lyase